MNGLTTKAVIAAKELQEWIDKESVNDDHPFGRLVGIALHQTGGVTCDEAIIALNQMRKSEPLSINSAFWPPDAPSYIKKLENERDLILHANGTLVLKVEELQAEISQYKASEKIASEQLSRRDREIAKLRTAKTFFKDVSEIANALRLDNERLRAAVRKAVNRWDWPGSGCCDKNGTHNAASHQPECFMVALRNALSNDRDSSDRHKSPKMTDNDNCVASVGVNTDRQREIMRKYYDKELSWLDAATLLGLASADLDDETDRTFRCVCAVERGETCNHCCQVLP